MNIGQFISHMILNSKLSNQQILDLVYQEFNSQEKPIKTSLACIAWYKTKLRKEGKLEGGRSQKNHVEFSAERLAELASK